MRSAVRDKAPPGSADSLTGCKVPYFAQGCKDQQNDTFMICRHQVTLEVIFSSNLNHGALPELAGLQAVSSPHRLEGFAARRGMRS